MNSQLAKQVTAKARQMLDFHCECSTVADAHTKRDCGAIWHRQTWHAGRTVAGCEHCQQMPLPAAAKAA